MPHSNAFSPPVRRPSWRVLRAAWPAALLTAFLTLPLAAQPDPNPDPVPGDYRVVEGKVDAGTYTGWRLFHTTCYGCHGVGGGGTDVAPNLVERVKTLTPRAFVTKVLTSYRIVLPVSESNDADRAAALDALLEEVMRRDRSVRGQITMPAWEANPTVNAHVLDLFAYLTARADGKLGPGKPLLWQAGDDSRVFSGDLARADVLLIESPCGNRIHPAKACLATARKPVGHLVCTAFAANKASR